MLRTLTLTAIVSASAAALPAVAEDFVLDERQRILVCDSVERLASILSMMETGDMESVRGIVAEYRETVGPDDAHVCDYWADGDGNILKLGSLLGWEVVNDANTPVPTVAGASQVHIVGKSASKTAENYMIIATGDPEGQAGWYDVITRSMQAE